MRKCFCCGCFFPRNSLYLKFVCFFFFFLQRSDSLQFAILREIDLRTFSWVRMVKSIACLICHITGGFCAWKPLFSSEWRRISIYWRVNRESSELLADGNVASNNSHIMVNPPITSVLKMRSVTTGYPIGMEKNRVWTYAFWSYIFLLFYTEGKTCAD